MEINTEPIFVLHNVSSVTRCTDFVKVVRGLGFRNIVISRPQSAAAQSGVPSAQKHAIQDSLNFFVLHDLKDVLDVFSPDEIYVFAPRPYGKERFDPEEAAEYVRNGKKTLFIFGGSDPGLSRKELDVGKSVHIHVPKDPGSTGTVAIALYDLARAIHT